MMTTVRRAGATSATTLFGLAMTIGVAHAVAPEWTVAAGLNIWEAPALSQEIETCSKHCGMVSEQIEESKNRAAIKEHVIDLLIDGQMRFKDAADQFLELNRGLPGHMATIRRSYEGATDEEKTARNVMAYVAQRERGSLFHRMGVRARLLAESHELASHAPLGHQ